MSAQMSHVESLIAKAAETHKSEDAQRFSQAALNAQHALNSIAIKPALTPQTFSTLIAKNQIEHMVSRFLGWRLPENFTPDGGVSFKRGDPRHPMPTGTNVFDGEQATAMVKHMLEGMPPPA